MVKFTGCSLSIGDELVRKLRKWARTDYELVAKLQQSHALLQSDTTYDFLKIKELNDITKLYEMKGKFVHLPELPGEQNALPKGFGSSSAAQFLLSEQRLKLLNEAIDFALFPETKKNAGFVPSGPNGVGKV